MMAIVVVVVVVVVVGIPSSMIGGGGGDGVGWRNGGIGDEPWMSCSLFLSLSLLPLGAF